MMTPAEMLETVKEYQTTDSISRKNALFDLIGQRVWEVWLRSYQCARKLYLGYPLPEVGKILNGWGPIEKDLEKYVDGHSYYTQINIRSPDYYHPIWDDEIRLSGLTEKGIKIGLPTSIAVSYRMFNPGYLDYRIREIKPYLLRGLIDEIYRKKREIKQLQSEINQLQSVCKEIENPILSKLKTAEPGTTLWYERWYKGQRLEAEEVTFLGIDNGKIMVDVYGHGIEVPFDDNGTKESENDYTSQCMLFPSSDHKRWDDVTYVPASKQVLRYDEE